MIKRMTMLRRDGARTVAAFREHWRGPHATIAGRMPGLHRYVQNHLIRTIEPDVGAPPFDVDGIPELWFLSEEDKATAFQSEAAKALPVDEKNFIQGITIFAIEETVLRDGTGATKVLFLARGQSYAAETLNQTLPGVLRCVRNRVTSVDHRPGVWHEPAPPNLIVEFRFASGNAAKAAFRSSAYQSFVAEAQEGNARLMASLVDEVVVVGPGTP